MKTKTPTINVSPRFSRRLAPTLVVAAVFILSVAAQRTYASPGDLYASDGSGNIYEFTPGGTRSTFASGLDQPFGVAFDSAGNLFEADQFSGNIYKFTPGGTRSTFASGLSSPAGLAFDSAGNLFAADEGSGIIYKFTPGGTRSAFASGLIAPTGLAFDSAGNLFAADLGSGNIYEFNPEGGKSTFASVLNAPSGLAFDSAGNLFEADEGSGNIFKFTPGGTPSTFASGLTFPAGLAFDSAGNLFVADAGIGDIFKFTPGGGTRITFASGLSDPIFLAFEPPPRPATLGNISTRLQVGTSNRVMIAGFIVQGSSPKMVLIRAIGPSLTNFGVPNVLANPQLELHNANGVIARNDNWQTTQIGGIITSNQVAEIQSSHLAPTNPAESAIIATLPPGNYTAIVRGVNNTTGNGLAEVYDVNPTSGSLLANLSTRGFVQTGDNVMIGGFIVVTQPTRVIIRAIGPSLTHLGVPTALANPQLELHDHTQAVIGRNDNWQQTQIGGIITSDQVAEIQNSGLAPANPAESAIIATLQPGNYTAIVRGVNNTTGIALAEVYDLQ
jgi:sugar lactone lactonase YvrE